MERLGIYSTSFFAALLASIIDMANNKDYAATMKLTEVINLLVPGFELVLVSLLLVGVIGIFFCFVFEPINKPDAFARGMSVFATLAILVPVQKGRTATIPESNTNSHAVLSFFPQAFADDGAAQTPTKKLTVKLKKVPERIKGEALLRQQTTNRIVTRFPVPGNEFSLPLAKGRYFLQLELTGYKRVKIPFLVGDGDANLEYQPEATAIPLWVQSLIPPQEAQAQVQFP